MKLLLSVVIIISCAYIGWILAKGLRRRPEELRALQGALNLLFTEVDYRDAVLASAFQKVAEASSWPADAIFGRAAEALEQGSLGVGPALEWAMEDVYPKTALLPSDAQALIDLSLSLGRSHREDQLRHIRICLERLASLETAARQGAVENARLFTYLGVLSGLAFVVLVM